MIEPESDMEIDLLRWAQALNTTRIEKLTRPRILGGIADIFYKQAGFLGYLLFDHEGGFRDAPGCQLRGTEELRQHAAQTPTIAQFPRPWHLQIGLRAAACYLGRPGRQRHAEHQRQVDLPRDRTDLPLDRRSNVGESGASRRFDVCEVCRQG